MASPGNQHCANCIGTVSFPPYGSYLTVPQKQTEAEKIKGIKLKTLDARLSRPLARPATPLDACIH